MDKQNTLKSNLNPLIIILIVAALVIGYLFAKVQTLEKRSAGGKSGSNEAVNDSGQQPTGPKVGDVDPVTKDDHIRGDLSKAKIALIEYSDLECPFCKRFHSTAKQALDEYGDDLIWVYRHFPLEQLHKKAKKEANAVECAEDLGGNEAFWALTDKIFETTQGNDSLDLDTLPDLAADIGLDKDKFKSCLDSDKFKDKIEKQYQSGIKAGVTGTPGNILMNLKTKETTLIPGAVPLETLKEAIDKML